MQPAARRGRSRDRAARCRRPGSPDAEIIPVSTVTGEGIDALRAASVRGRAWPSKRAADGRFRLAVDRSFTLAGAGTVVTGTVLSGAVAVGDRVMVSPSGLPARVRSIHAQNRPAERGQAGERCALNLAGDGISQGRDRARRRGARSGAARADRSRSMRRCACSPASRSRSRNGCRCACIMPRPRSAPASCCSAMTRSRPAAKARVQLVLERRSPPRPATASSCATHRRSARSAAARFSICARPRASAARRSGCAQLDALRDRRPGARAGGAARSRRLAMSILPAFARDRALTSTEMDAIADRPWRRRRSQARARRLRCRARPHGRRLKRRLARRARGVSSRTIPDLPGIGLERLRLQLEPRLPAPRFLRGAAGACARGRDRARRRLGAAAEPRGAADAERREALARIAPLLAGAERFRPPRVRDIAGAARRCRRPRCAALLKLLGRMGKVDEVAHDHFFLRGTVAEMVGDRRRSRRRGAERRVHRRAVPRPARQRPQGRNPDSGILRSPRRDAAPRRSAPHQQASARSVSPRRQSRTSGARRVRKRSVPGGASGLQIREGPRAGPWWVRLPLSSATFPSPLMRAISLCSRP